MTQAARIAPAARATTNMRDGLHVRKQSKDCARRQRSA